MLLQSFLNIDNPHKSEILIRKVFQVVFLGPARPDRTRQIDLYTALLISSRADLYLRINITQQLNERSPVSLRDVGPMFFARDDILRQFWGGDTMTLNRVEDLSRHVPNGPSRDALLAAVTPSWPPPGSGVPPLLVREKEKDIGPLLVLPASATLFKDKAILDLHQMPSTAAVAGIGLDVAAGYWLHARFVSSADTHNDLIELEHELKCTSPSTVEELRVYYSCPPHCDILDQSGHVFTSASLATEKPTNEIVTELYKVYSQSRVKYFDEWSSLGIHSGTLLRVHQGAALDAALVSQRLHTFLFQFRATDVQATRRRELRALVASVWLAAITAVGVDWTRLDAVKALVPLQTTVAPTFWWLLMCGSLVPVLLSDASGRLRKALTILNAVTMASFGLWFALAFLLTPALQSYIHLATWIVYLPVIVFCGGASVLTLHQMETRRSKLS